MKRDPHVVWAVRNQACLLAEFARLGARLGLEAAEAKPSDAPAPPQGSPPAIDVLTTAFQLSAFERDLLLLCAGVEMEAVLAERCAVLQGASQPHVTYGLAMSVLEDAHWSAFAPSSPLRRFRLVEVESGQRLMASPLRIDERILHYLAGMNRIDSRLASLLTARAAPPALAEAHARLVEATTVSLGAEYVLHLQGDDRAGQEAVAAAIASRQGRALFVLGTRWLPQTGPELETFLALWTRENLLLPAALLVQLEDEAPLGFGGELVERLPGPVFVASRGPIRLNRFLNTFDVDKPAPPDQKRLWEQALGPLADQASDAIEQLAQQFRLSAGSIVELGAGVRRAGDLSREDLGRRLWSACRAAARPYMEALAERIVPRARWDDLVLPELQTQVLRQLSAHVRHRMTVYERWGFAARGGRGLGLSALFSGPSGAGKTLAAEVLAAELELDLYRIDLSAVVSKYIGETEKNMRRVFDAAESGGALLLFDEADALFGKRSEVKDSHDRYANIEVGYLLQRMEAFQGLAILTTNMKSSLDKAFQRRLRFHVEFPFPCAAERAQIWTRVFPPEVPTEGLDPVRLASLHMAGGGIRNIALNAAFLAAEENGPVRMRHVLQATQFEAAKAERPISEAEISGWV
jgi:hypothetical protein